MAFKFYPTHTPRSSERARHNDADVEVSLIGRFVTVVAVSAAVLVVAAIAVLMGMA